MQTPNLCFQALCSGCASCLNACPYNAISTSLDANGFLEPNVNAEKCVGCKLCEKACPIISRPKLERTETPKVYACWNNDPEIRRQSSSGGMFSVYANRIISEGGVVFGVTYDKSMKVVFAKAKSSEDLTRFRSSKYVQARVGTVYRDVKSELNSGRDVLFVGTPCQIGGLYGYLGTDYPNLYTCDLVCRGVPSPVLYKKWLRFLEEKLGGKIVSLNMRAKRGSDSHFITAASDAFPSKSLKVEWGEDARSAYVGRMFMKGISLRSSCEQCQFAKFPRIGDVTLGDFWGVGKDVLSNKPVDGGISLNVVNSEKGARLVERCRQDAEWFERSLEEAKAKNPSLYVSQAPNPAREDFLRDAQTLDYKTLARKYRKELEGSLFKRIERRIRFFRKRVVDVLRFPKR